MALRTSLCTRPVNTYVMKKIFIIISCLNLYYFLNWTYVFNKYDSFDDKKSNFIKNWLVFENIGTLDISLSLLTIISMFLILTKNKNNSLLNILCLIINILFLLFVIWSNL